MQTIEEAGREKRSENRYNRLTPTLVVPWNDGSPKEDQLLYGVSKNLSTHGMAVILPDHLHNEYDLICVFWADGPTFLHGEAQYEEYVGGGFWQVGLDFREKLEPDEFAFSEGFERCVRYLSPSAKVRYSPADAERRRSVRIPSPNSERHATLQFKRQKISARVVDQSTGGFSVALPRDPGARIGEVMTLTTNGGCWDVEVTRYDCDDEGARIALKTVRDVVPGARQSGNSAVAVILAVLAAAVAMGYMLLG